MSALRASKSAECQSLLHSSQQGSRPLRQSLYSPRQLTCEKKPQYLLSTCRYARDAFLIAYTALVENTLVAALTALRVDQLLRAATPYLENGYAALTRARSTRRLLCPP